MRKTTNDAPLLLYSPSEAMARSLPNQSAYNLGFQGIRRRAVASQFRRTRSMYLVLVSARLPPVGSIMRDQSVTPTTNPIRRILCCALRSSMSAQRTRFFPDDDPPGLASSRSSPSSCRKSSIVGGRRGGLLIPSKRAATNKTKPELDTFGKATQAATCGEIAGGTE